MIVRFTALATSIDDFSGQDPVHRMEIVQDPASRALDESAFAAIAT
jgi:hypothetical protein